MAFFDLHFLTHTPELLKLRGVFQGIGQQGYTTFNALSRGMNNLDRATNRALSNMQRFMGGGFLAKLSQGISYSLYQSNSMITTNKIMLEELVSSADKARRYIKVVQDLSGNFGLDMTEMMTASRGMTQMFSQMGNASPEKHLKPMLKLITAMSLLDTENRGLAYTAFSFKEALQGVGQGDWRSMKNRLEVNLGKTYEKAITKAVKAKDLDTVVKLFDEAFKRIGINADGMIKRIMNEGLTQNMSRTITYMGRVFQLIGEKSYLALAKPFARLNTFIARQFETDDAGKPLSKFMKDIYRMSDDMKSTFIDPFTKNMDRFTVSFAKNLDGITKGVISLAKGGFTLFAGLFQPLIMFTKGLFGMSDGVGVSNDMFGRFEETATKLGETLEKIGSFFYRISMPIYDFAKAINVSTQATMKLLSVVPPALMGGLFGGIIGGAKGHGMLGAGLGMMGGGMMGASGGGDMWGIINAAMTAIFGYQLVKGMFGGKGKGGAKGGIPNSAKGIVAAGVANEIVQSNVKSSFNSQTDDIKTNSNKSKYKIAPFNQEFGYKKPLWGLGSTNLSAQFDAEHKQGKFASELNKTIVNQNRNINAEIAKIEENMKKGGVGFTASFEKENLAKIQNLRNNIQPEITQNFAKHSAIQGGMFKTNMQPDFDTRLAEQRKFDAGEYRLGVNERMNERLANKAAIESRMFGAEGYSGKFVRGMTAPSVSAGLNTIFGATLVANPLMSFMKWIGMTTVAGFALLSPLGLAAIAFGTLTAALGTATMIINSNNTVRENELQNMQEEQNQRDLKKQKTMNEAILGAGYSAGGIGDIWAKGGQMNELTNNPSRLIARLLIANKNSPDKGAATSDLVTRAYNAKMSNNWSDEQGQHLFGKSLWAAVGNPNVDPVNNPNPVETVKLILEGKGFAKDAEKIITAAFLEILQKEYTRTDKSGNLIKNQPLVDQLIQNMKYGNPDGMQ